jgi:hypothetical protein
MNDWACNKLRVLLPQSSGDLLPPSPPAEKATARKDQAGKASTGDGGGDGRSGKIERKNALAELKLKQPRVRKVRIKANSRINC